MVISHYGSSPSYQKSPYIQFKKSREEKEHSNTFKELWKQWWQKKSSSCHILIPTKLLLSKSVSNLQLGTAIYNEQQSNCFFSHKHNPTQHFPSCVQQGSYLYPGSSPAIPLILYGSDIVIKTEHKNLIQHNLISNYLLHWCLFHWRILFHLWTFEHLSSFTNIVTYQLSHLPLSVPEK